MGTNYQVNANRIQLLIFKEDIIVISESVIALPNYGYNEFSGTWNWRGISQAQKSNLMPEIKFTN